MSVRLCTSKSAKKWQMEKTKGEKICLYFYLVLYGRLLGPWITERLSIITLVTGLQNNAAAVTWKIQSSR